MHDWQSLSHVRWEYKYNVVLCPNTVKKGCMAKPEGVWEKF
jgi:hypothetical protein